MKKLIFILFILFTQETFAQRYSHCAIALDLSYGGTRYGSIGQFGVTKYIGNKSYLRIFGLYNAEKKDQLSHQVMGVNLIYGRTVLSINNNVFINAVVGGLGSYENSLERLSYEINRLGVIAGGEMEVFFSDRVSSILSVHEKYLFNQGMSTINNRILWGQYRWHATVGIRIHMYSVHCEPARLHRSRWIRK